MTVATGTMLRWHVTRFMRTISLEVDEALMNVNTGPVVVGDDVAPLLFLLLAVFNHAYGGCKSPERLRSHSIFLVTLALLATATTAFASFVGGCRSNNGMDAHHGEGGFERHGDAAKAPPTREVPSRAAVLTPMG